MNDSGGVTTIIATCLGGENFADALSAFMRGIEIGKSLGKSAKARNQSNIGRVPVSK